MLIKKITTKLSYALASLVLLTAQMTPFFVMGGRAGANPTNGGSPQTECSDRGLFYLDKIDEIKDDNDNDNDADGDYLSDEGNSYYVDVDDNPNPQDSTYTLNPEPKSSGYYDSVPDIDLDSIIHFGKFGEGGGLSHITICYDKKPDTGSITIKKNAISDSDQAFKFTTTGLSTDVGGFELIDDTVTGLPEKVFTGLNADTYVIEELGTSGWYLDDISCSSELESTIIEVGGEVTITLKQGDNVSCVFVNRQKEVTENGVLIVKKILNKYGDRTEEPSDFNFKVNGGDPVQFISSGYNTAENRLELPEGTYSVIEVEEGLNNYKTEYEDCNDIEVVADKETVCTITNTDMVPLLSVTKKVVNDDGYGTNLAEDFDLFVNDELLDDPRKGGGDIELSSVTYLHPGTIAGVPYTITETNKSNYTAGEVKCYDAKTRSNVSHPVVLEPGQHVICEITNDDKVPPATIFATKIVCDDELLLPNWGGGGPNITESTVVDWLANPDKDGCELAEGWNFEYAFNNTSNPGDNEEVGGTNWTPFGPTNSSGETSVEFDASDLSGVNRIWVREQLKDGYIGFTYNLAGNNSDDISAEIYCNRDVLNYDNFDFIDRPQLGNSYYCVAWNVKEAVIRVHKEVVNNDNGIKEAEDFEFTVNGEDRQNFAEEGEYVELSLKNGEYTISEVPVEGYSATYDGCENIVAVAGNTYDCYVKNTADSTPPRVYVTKHTCESNQEYQLLSVFSEYCDDNTEFKFKLFNNGQYAEFGLSNGGTYDTGDKLKPGSVEIIELEKEGWKLVNSNCYYYEELEFDYSDRVYGDDVFDNRVFVGTKFTAENGVKYYCDFYNEKVDEEVFGEIVVTKFNDINNNGVWDEDEPTLQGWKINVEGVGSEVTNESGTATFSQLAFGDYVVTETMQDGWAQTVNNCDATEDGITVDSEESVECYIGNYKKPSTGVLGDTDTVTPAVLATTGSSQSSYMFATGLTLIAATIVTSMNRKKVTVSAK